MGSGNAASYWREALIEFALIIKPVCGDHDLVNLALPLPHKARSGFESLSGVILGFRIQRKGDLLELCFGFGPQAAVSQFLDPEGEDWEHQLAAKARRCWPTKTLLP
jgi:hypothetical protein